MSSGSTTGHSAHTINRHVLHVLLQRKFEGRKLHHGYGKICYGCFHITTKNHVAYQVLLTDCDECLMRITTWLDSIGTLSAMILKLRVQKVMCGQPSDVTPDELMRVYRQCTTEKQPSETALVFMNVCREMHDNNDDPTS